MVNKGEMWVFDWNVSRFFLRLFFSELILFLHLKFLIMLTLGGGCLHL